MTIWADEHLNILARRYTCSNSGRQTVELADAYDRVMTDIGFTNRLSWRGHRAAKAVA